MYIYNTRRTNLKTVTIVTAAQVAIFVVELKSMLLHCTSNNYLFFQIVYFDTATERPSVPAHHAEQALILILGRGKY